MSISATLANKSRFFFAVTVCWLLDLAGQLCTPSSSLYLAFGPFPLKLLLLAINFFAWTVVWGVIGGIVILLKTAIWPTRPWMKWALLPVSMLGAGVYLLDWNVYREADVFIGWEAIEFIRVNFRELLFDISQVQIHDIEMLIAAAILSGAALFWGLPKLFPFWERWERKKGFRISLVAVFFVGLAGSVWSYATGPNVVLYMARHRTSPVLEFITDSMERFSLFSRLHPPAQKATYLLNDKKRIISMSDYLKSQSAAKHPHYNVIYISIESLRADRLKCLGGTRDVMPTLDALAKSSVVFSSAYSEGTYTALAESTAVTSQYPLRGTHTNVENGPIEFPRVMLYDVLKALGYRTALFASQNLNWGGQTNMLSTGGLDTIVHAENSKGKSYLDEHDYRAVHAVQLGMFRVGYVYDQSTMDDALAWVKQGGKTPFFLYLNLQHSHFPYTLPEGEKPTFSPSEIDFPISFARYPREKMPVMMNRYDNSLHYIDGLISQFFAQLKTLGLFDNTIVVISGDHGEAFYEHGIITHGSHPLIELIHIPLIIHAPGLAPRLDPAPVQHVDIAPSVISLLGYTPHPAFQGLNVFDKKELEHRPVFSMAMTPLVQDFSVIQDHYQLIYSRKAHAYGLFDLAHDPGELQNIYPTHPDVARHLSQIMNFWIQCQVTYYDNPPIYQRFYPPSYPSSPLPAGAPAKT